MIDRRQPPPTPELPRYRLPPVVETKLANGLEALLVEDRRCPLVSARLGFPAGSKHDPAGLYGLAESTAALLTEGTTRRTAREMAEEAAAIGGSVRAGAGADTLVVAGDALAENLGRLLDLMADAARNAVFPEEEVQLRKQNRRQELLAQRARAEYLADEKLTEVVLAPHPYAHQSPTLESIDRLERGLLAGFGRGHLTPAGAVLILTGALPPPAQVLETIEEAFGGWEPRQPPAPPAARFPEPSRSITLIDRPGSVQADIRLGRLAANRASPDYFPLLVGNTILGGGASSRLFANIREQRGYAYDAHSAVHPLKDTGSLEVVTQVRNEVVDAALEAVLAEMSLIGRDGVSEEELSTARNFLSGVFVIRLETQEALANQLSVVKLMGLPLEYVEQYTARVWAAAPEEIRAAAARYMNPAQAAIVVVGDGAKILKPLEKFGPVTVERAG
ncbi:MAG: pitrilysin family protein [Acidobacteriota bacterium]